ncbi:Hypothetical protein GLP15_3835 [Giardia lamblia P15]|uniref:Pyrroline-5-carboxylate reductase catalytic N-terminal domain-containing protein n=1 Tax=Giardia intestinalis (strain P15) TaxID=658858 RepID=E1F9F4_GIAIA|nr:Hypothetical protein GLP15_3835 [Giardia lamblia P15]
MERWYEKAVANLIRRPYYSKAVSLVHSANYADILFINQCISAVDGLHKGKDSYSKGCVPGAPSFVVVVGTGRIAQLVLKDVLLPKQVSVKVLSLGRDTIHSERISELGIFVTTDLNILLTAELILLCLPAVDATTIEAHITNFGLKDKVVRFTCSDKATL